MRTRIRSRLATARRMTALIALLPFAAAHAQSAGAAGTTGATSTGTTGSDWRYALSVYGYFPSVSGASSTPTWRW